MNELGAVCKWVTRGPQEAMRLECDETVEAADPGPWWQRWEILAAAGVLVLLLLVRR